MTSTTTRFIELISELVLLIAICILVYLPDADVKLMLFATAVYIGMIAHHSCTEICRAIQDTADNKRKDLNGEGE